MPHPAPPPARPHSMVAFPPPGGEYTHSGEGGMYVMVVAPDSSYAAPDSVGLHACTVDVGIFLTMPNVCVTPYGGRDGGAREAWWRQVEDEAATRIATEEYLAARGETRMREWVRNAYHSSVLSVPMLGAFHLGSTAHALWSERAGRYWYATEDDLTPEGLGLVADLRAAHGEAHILTFLDT